MEGSEHSIDQPSVPQRRSWTEHEEVALASIMEELVAKGHKCEGGNFRAGTIKIIVKMMNEKCPGCGVIAKHIQNKNKRWKEKCGAMLDMLHFSGFSWNDTKKCVEVDNHDVLKSYIRKHPDKPNMAGKPFPLFEKLQNVYGKDHASRKAAESPYNALELLEIQREQNVIQTDHATGIAFESPVKALVQLETQEQNGEHAANGDQEIRTHCPPSDGNSSATSGSTSQNKSRKRSRKDDKIVQLIEAFNNAITGAREASLLIASKINSIEDAKAGVAGELMKMNLTIDEQIETGMKLMDNPDYVYLFWGFVGRQREAFVRRLLR